MFARNCRSTHKRSFCTKTHGFKRYEKSSSSADIAVLIFRFTGIRWKMLGWLSADTDRGCEAENTLCICSLRGFSLKYTHAYKKVWAQNWANEQKKRLLSQERVRTARPAYRHESLSELMMIQLYDAFTPVVSIWKDWILSKAAANMVFIDLALSFWMCLLYFWVIIPCIHYVFADSPISRKKRCFTCCLGRISVKSVFVF